jgi:uncharacterized protein YjiS (DUF1127 family)
MTARCPRPAAASRRLDDCAFSLRASRALDRAHAAIDMIGVWLVRRRRRRTLGEIAALGDRVMLDLGFDPVEVRIEAAKPFWRK